MAPPTIAEVLVRIRSDYERVDAQTAVHLVDEGALLVDIRPVGLRERDGELPGAAIVDRNQLEWRLDPSSSHRLVVVDDTFYERPVVLVCDEGFASTLAVASLRAIGLSGATDLAGGFQAWREAGQPVVAPGDPSPASPTVADEGRARGG